MGAQSPQLWRHALEAIFEALTTGSKDGTEFGLEVDRDNALGPKE